MVLNSFWNIYAEQKEKQGKSYSCHCGGFRSDHLSFLHYCFQNCDSNCAKGMGEGPASDLVVLTFTYFPSPVPLFLLLTSSLFLTHFQSPVELLPVITLRISHRCFEVNGTGRVVNVQNKLKAAQRYCLNIVHNQRINKNSRSQMIRHILQYYTAALHLMLTS